jgi:hypothetical protein
MCHFFSAVMVEDGTLYWDPLNMSHSYILAKNKLPDDPDKIVRLEFRPSPVLNGYAFLDTYSFVIDQDELPGWWNNQRQSDACAQMRRLVEGMIISDQPTDYPRTERILCGQTVILTGKGEVHQMLHCRVLMMAANAYITNMSYCYVDSMQDYAHIHHAERSQIDGMYGHSSVHKANFSHINDMTGHSCVRNALTSTIKTIAGEAHIDYLDFHSSVTLPVPSDAIHKADQWAFYRIQEEKGT